MSKVRIDLDVIVVQVWILSPLQHARTMSNRLKTLLGTGDGKLDHRSGLGKSVKSLNILWDVTHLLRAQFEVVSLIGHKGAKLHGEESGALSLNQWQLPVLKVDVVHLLKVLIDGSFHVSTGLLVLPGEAVVLGIETALDILPLECLDGVDLVI